MYALPAAANAAVVFVRVEAPGGPLVPKTEITLPTDPVPASGAADGHTCPGDTVIGALDTATGGDWSGVWSDANGWSIQRIRGLDLPDGGGRRWVVYVEGMYVNAAPCGAHLTLNQNVLIYPACTTATTRCFSGEPLLLRAPSIGSPSVLLRVEASQTATVFSSGGIGTSIISAAVGATVTGPDGSAIADIYGVAVVPVYDRGPQTVTRRANTLTTIFSMRWALRNAWSIGSQSLRSPSQQQSTSHNPICVQRSGSCHRLHH